MPTVPDLTHKVVKSVDEAKELARQGFHILDRISEGTDKLLHGSMAFCVFSGTELMHIGWLCMTEEARNSVQPIPYGVDFSRMAAIEGSETLPNFRSKRTLKIHRSYRGFLAYCYFKRAQYLIEHGIFIARYVILTDNYSSQKIVERFGTRKHSIIRLTKILGLKFWKELPVPQPDILTAGVTISS